MLSASPRPAWLALAAGLGSALVSAYWACGGTWLLDTLGGTLEAAARQGGLGAAGPLWSVAGVKLIAAVLPVLATGRLTWHRSVVRGLAWIEACVLTGYGLALTSVGLLVQAGVVASVDANQRAMAWHAYFWDPWFFLWGLLCIAALRAFRHGAPVGASWHPNTTVTDG